MSATQLGSSSLDHPEYWWYRARASLLQSTLERFLGSPDVVLDVGSADGPSVGWMRGSHARITMDINPQGLVAGEGVCGSALALPFADESFDVVSAFDVVEHCEPESRALDELTRVLRPGGRLLLSVPAYQWAWSDHDVQAGHYRRYTRRRLVAAVNRTGVETRRATYGFCAVFPFFLAERVVRRVKKPGAEQRLTAVPRRLERVLMRLSRLDERLLGRFDLPFGSSVFLAAVKPAREPR
jgi:SAM-dependent methyltransferase